ncbi:MAG: hypothetical protein IPH03_09080 [Tetrasphaera sp.]|nr:hypothetical protein [Tetrasphaera sp.]
MTRWATGADQIADMLAAGELEQVAPSPQNAARLLAEAERHLRSAALLGPDDPAGAYDMLYAAARKAMAAALAVQGLRSTSKGWVWSPSLAPGSGLIVTDSGPTSVAAVVPSSGGCVVVNVGPTRGEGLHVNGCRRGGPGEAVVQGGVVRTDPAGPSC